MSCCAVHSLVAAGDDCRCWTAAPPPPARDEQSPAASATGAQGPEHATALAAVPAPAPLCRGGCALPRQAPVPLFTLHATLLI